MSYTEMKRVWPGKRVASDVRFGNANQTVTPIWEFMCLRYLGKHFFEVNSGPAGVQRLWDLGNRKDIPEHHRVVLVMTFDYAYVLKEDYEQAARSIRQTIEEGMEAGNWAHIAQYLEERTCPAVGFYMHSCGEDLWGRNKDWSKFYSVYEYVK